MMVTMQSHKCLKNVYVKLKQFWIHCYLNFQLQLIMKDIISCLIEWKHGKLKRTTSVSSSLCKCLCDVNVKNVTVTIDGVFKMDCELIGGALDGKRFTIDKYTSNQKNLIFPATRPVFVHNSKNDKEVVLHYRYKRIKYKNGIVYFKFDGYEV